MLQGQPRGNEVTFVANDDKTCMYVSDLKNMRDLKYSTTEQNWGRPRVNDRGNGLLTD